MGMFDYLTISSTALTAEKTRIDIIAKNMANANTTRATGGLPYRRQVPVFKEFGASSFEKMLKAKMNKSTLKGVKITKIAEDPSPYKTVFDPGHPDADEKGYVRMPNVDIVKEMVDMISAQRAYDSNVTAINTVKAMMNRALDIGARR